MIPYVTVPPLFVGSVAIQPFALLVSIGVLVGHFLLLARARRAGLPAKWAAEFSVAMVVSGFVGAGLYKLLYRPELLVASGWSALRGLPGISSFGGLFGALAGGVAYLAARRAGAVDRLRYFDAAGFAFPFGLAFGRLGCSLAHDHPGVRSDGGWLTVAYPEGARYDLGVLELLFLGAVCAVFAWLGRRAHRPGFFPALLLLLYGPFRVALDRLHVDPPRYAGLSVDQWSGAFAAVIGLLFWQRLGKVRPL